jgi:integrase
MATRIRFLLLRDGRYFARKVVPERLRADLGSEKRIPLGADRRTAIAQLPAALVMIDAEFARAAAKLSGLGDAAVKLAPVDVLELAKIHYARRLSADERARNGGSAWATVGINDAYVAALRSALAGKLTDGEVDGLLGDVLAEFSQRGLLAGTPASAEWREAARAIADAELHALQQVSERDEGVATSALQHPSHLVASTEEQGATNVEGFVSLRGLLEDHISQLEKDGRGRAARKAWPRFFDNLIDFLIQSRGSKRNAAATADNALKLTADELIAWRNELLTKLDAKTVKDTHVAAVKAVLQRAVEDRKLESNVSQDVKVRSSKRPQTRDKGYTDDEAVAVLSKSLHYMAAPATNPATRESKPVSAAKKWGPLLCAFTGARVTEILQLRKSDITISSTMTVLRITPDAGTVKDRTFRDVPLHQQAIDLGFLTFVTTCADGPLFYSADADPSKLPAQVVAGRLSSWIRKNGLAPTGVAPNHGWRHRFKSQAIELGINPRVYDAIQGHAGRTASDGYGSVSLKTKKHAIDQFPRYAISASVG